MRQEMSSLKDLVLELKDNIGGGKRNGTASSWDDLSEDQLFSYATSEEVVTTKPQTAIHAAIKLAEKRIQGSQSKLKEEILGEVLGRVQKQSDNQVVLQRITRDFGREALDQDSELFQVANERYIAYQNKYGAQKVNDLPEYKYWAVKEAAEELGRIQPKGNAANTQPVSQPAPQKIQGPPAGLMTEGSSQGAADQIAERRALLDKGQGRAALRSLAKALYE